MAFIVNDGGNWIGGDSLSKNEDELTCSADHICGKVELYTVGQCGWKSFVGSLRGLHKYGTRSKFF